MFFVNTHTVNNFTNNFVAPLSFSDAMVVGSLSITGSSFTVTTEATGDDSNRFNVKSYNSAFSVREYKTTFNVKSSDGDIIL